MVIVLIVVAVAITVIVVLLKTPQKKKANSLTNSLHCAFYLSTEMAPEKDRRIL